ncbi:hypothetical protein MKZ20_21515 [Psychrobacillus sp. FSL K6-2684]|uniref:hypothetical protein n=1 Tax=unclassified Psychrobacillus TaxID=2636677 RepID=UPI0030F6D7B2
MAEQLSNGIFPSITYGVYEFDVLSLKKVFAGLTIESTDGKLGIVTGVNKKTIPVTYVNHISVAGSPQGFKSSTATQARSNGYEDRLLD